MVCSRHAEQGTLFFSRLFAHPPSQHKRHVLHDRKADGQHGIEVDGIIVAA